ncbi:PQQ-binding-like beta-propeller repeat protein [Nocardiopsis sp. NPDC007018]|uniref:outer membrane protein assembly factor BamB family protein n=1 Tax=Nocardiopsis sp. NPDC007018 TaxID=3155721 RepID=UPI0033E44E53
MTRPDTAPEGGGCQRWFLGCLVVPLCAVLVLALVLFVGKGFREGHLLLNPEVAGNTAWSVEGLPGEVVGGWASDAAVVYATEDGITAVDVGEGAERWRLEPSEAVCAMAQESRGGVGVFLVEGETEPDDVEGEEEVRSCDTALLVDLDSGEEVWRAGPLADAEGARAELLFSRGSGVAHVGDRVLVRAGGELVGLDAASGEESWRRGSLRAEGVACPAADFMDRGEGEVVVVGDCGADESVTVHVVSPVTGEDVSAFAFERGRSGPKVDAVGATSLVAAEPIHVRVDLGHRRGFGSGGYDPEEEAGQARERQPVLAFDDDGRVRNELVVSGLFPVGGGEARPFVVRDGLLYSSTDHSSCSNEVRAHDLETGELVWETALGDPGVSVVGVREGRLLVMLDGVGSFGECHMLGPGWDWQLYALDAATGEAAPVSPPLRARQPRASELWWVGGGVVQVERGLTDRPHLLVSYR